MYNAAGTLSRMLHSIAGQSYENWRLILIDDMSDDGHIKAYNRYIADFNQILGEGKIGVIKNTEKRWEVANVLHGISMCEDEDIICRIDADDYLTDLDALAYLNVIYERTGAEVLWTNHRWGLSDKNISGPMHVLADPYKHPWVSSHLKTFRKRLINNVNDQNFRGEDGNYIRRAGDQAILLPILWNTKKRVYVNRCFYHYNINDVPETYQTDDARFQRDEALFLRARGYVK